MFKENYAFWKTYPILKIRMNKEKGKDIPVTGRGGPYGCDRLKLPHYLDKRLTDGSKVVSPMHRPHFTPRFPVIFFNKIPGTHIC
jgi:hypothetical protein